MPSAPKLVRQQTGQHRAQPDPRCGAGAKQRVQGGRSADVGIRQPRQVKDVGADRDPRSARPPPGGENTPNGRFWIGKSGVAIGPRHPTAQRRVVRGVDAGHGLVGSKSLTSATP